MMYMFYNHSIQSSNRNLNACVLNNVVIITSDFRSILNLIKIVIGIVCEI